MDYIPRFSQPFTLHEAIALDVGIITEEIARLQNSLMHLKETQAFLEADLNESEESDLEIVKAFEENQGVIGSQEERISMLKMALTEKGIVAGAHYDLPPSTQPSQTAPMTPSEPVTNLPTSTTTDENDGVYL